MPDNNDIFEAKLDDTIQALQECQHRHDIQSCYVCGECIGCEIRAKYVRSVFESMSKGEIGGFDF
jgi:hypothetical protein